MVRVGKGRRWKLFAADYAIALTHFDPLFNHFKLRFKTAALNYLLLSGRR